MSRAIDIHCEHVLCDRPRNSINYIQCVAKALRFERIFVKQKTCFNLFQAVYFFADLDGSFAEDCNNTDWLGVYCFRFICTVFYFTTIDI